jgi:hypothetical protein
VGKNKLGERRGDMEFRETEREMKGKKKNKGAFRRHLRIYVSEEIDFHRFLGSMERMGWEGEREIT